MKNSLQKPLGFIDLEYEEHFEKFVSELTAKLEIKGKHDGMSNKPLNENEFLVRALNQIDASIQEEIHYNQMRYLPISGIAIAKQIENKATGRLNNIESDIRSAEFPYDKLKQKVDSLVRHRDDYILRWSVYISLGIISVAEAYFINEGLRSGGFPRMPASISSLSLGILMLWITHFGAQYIKEAKSRLGFVIRYISILFPAFVLSTFLGHLRADAYNYVARYKSLTPHILTSITSTSKWEITGITFLLFWGILFLSLRIYKNNPEKEALLLLKTNNKKLKEIENLRRAKKWEKSQIENETAKSIGEAYSRWEYAKSNEERLIALRPQFIAAYTDSNILYRTDGVCPFYFGCPPSRIFTRFFNTVNT